MKRPTYRITISDDCYDCLDRHVFYKYVSADTALDAQDRGYDIAIYGMSRGLNWRFEGVSLERGNPNEWSEYRNEAKKVIEEKGGVSHAV